MGAAEATGNVVALDALLSDRRVWRGHAPAMVRAALHPTGLEALDAVLPGGGWPDAALTELLLAADGVGELRLLLPTLVRLTRAGRDVLLVAPPYVPYPAGWRQAGVDFAQVHVIDASPRDALWATEQCLRAGCVAAVLCWPRQVDDRALRRLQVAAETGQALCLAFRDARAACNPSPAALRIAFDAKPSQLRVLKCRGGLAPAHPIPFMPKSVVPRVWAPHPQPTPAAAPAPGKRTQPVQTAAASHPAAAVAQPSCVAHVH